MTMENPMVGAFNRERTLLTFRQRSTEVYAAYLGMALGCLMMLKAVADLIQFRALVGYTLWFGFFGFLFAASAYWAFALFRSYKFDLRKKIYEERFGAAGRPVRIKGTFQDFHSLELTRYDGIMPTSMSIVLTPGQGPRVGGFDQLYVIRLRYHDSRRPPAVLEHIWSSTVGGVVDGQLMNFAQKAVQYADFLKVPLHSTVPLNFRRMP